MGRCRRKICWYTSRYCVGIWNMAQSSKPFIARSIISYGKLIEALERQTCLIYTKDGKVADRALRSEYLGDLKELGQAYELESRKPRITIDGRFQIGIAVYQLAKLRMLQFYYDILDRYFHRRDFKLIQMDTDSN